MATFVKTATSVIDSIDKSSPAMESTKELLDTLQELAKTKADLYEEQIQLNLQNAGVGADKTVPVVRTINRKKLTRTYSSESAEHLLENVGKEIKKLLGSISSGSSWDKIADAGIDIATKSINTAITAFLGSAIGKGAEDSDYKVVLDANSLVLLRLDYKGWAREITTTSIKQRCQKTVAYAYASSVVDMSKLKYETFRLYFNDLIKEEYKLSSIKALAKTKELYGDLCGSENYQAHSMAARNQRVLQGFAPESAGR